MKETHIRCGEGNMGAFLKLWRKGKGGDGLLSAERSISISLIRVISITLVKKSLFNVQKLERTCQGCLENFKELSVGGQKWVARWNDR